MTKIKRLPLAGMLAFSALASVLMAAPVRQETSIYAQPNSQAPVLTVIQPGNELPPRASGATAPAGWTAVQVQGPHEVYVDNKDINKALDVKPGAALRTEPNSNAPVLTTAVANDPMEITGLRGRWTQLRLNRAVTGYAQVSGGAGSAAVASTPSPQPASPAPAPAARQETKAAPAPAAAPAAPPAPQTAGRAVPIENRGDGGLAALPRLFEGRFVSTRSLLRPRRPFDYALEDESGVRIAYVDISRLLLTDQIENYIGRHVSAYGTAKPVPETKDIVITVESLQLR